MKKIKLIGSIACLIALSMVVAAERPSACWNDSGVDHCPNKTITKRVMLLFTVSCEAVGPEHSYSMPVYEGLQTYIQTNVMCNWSCIGYKFGEPYEISESNDDKESTKASGNPCVIPQS